MKWRPQNGIKVSSFISTQRSYPILMQPPDEDRTIVSCSLLAYVVDKADRRSIRNVAAVFGVSYNAAMPLLD